MPALTSIKRACVAVALLALSGCSSAPDSAPPPPDGFQPPPIGSKSGAYANCKGIVTSKLKAPATAQFQSAFGATITDLGKGTYVVLSYVDSQNVYGALLRAPFTCRITYDGRGSWNLETLRFSPP